MTFGVHKSPADPVKNAAADAKGQEWGQKACISNKPPPLRPPVIPVAGPWTNISNSKGLDQKCPGELSVMLKVFIICTMQIW